jgi:hypothetical protein
MGKVTARGGTWRLVACAVAAMLVSGCTTNVDGAVRPAANLVPKPVTGDAIKEVLPNAGRIESIVHEPVKLGNIIPPLFGGIEDMPNGLYLNEHSSPRECLGVTDLQQNSYRGASVQTFARNDWETGFNPTEIPKVVTVDVDAVALRTAADANTLFKTFTEQWKQCNGKTLTIAKPREDLSDITRVISDIRISDSMLTVSYQDITEGFPPALLTRSLGVRVNCLVDATIMYGRDPDNSAETITRLMMDQVSRFS